MSARSSSAHPCVFHLPPCGRRAGNVIANGIAASNYVMQVHDGLLLDAAASERFKHLVRIQ